MPASLGAVLFCQSVTAMPAILGAASPDPSASLLKVARARSNSTGLALPISKPEPDRAAVARDQERIAELAAHVGADPRLSQARRPVLIEQRKQRIGRANREAAAARQDVLDRIQGNRLLMPWTPPATIPTDDGTPPNSIAPLFR